MKKRVTYRCFTDSIDYGKKGATNVIVFSKENTEETIKSYAPSNWRIEKIEYEYPPDITCEE